MNDLPDDQCRVLVVDDDPLLRHLMARLCREIGAATQEATDGADAIRRVQRTPFDLIVLDLDMPVMDGRTFWRRMQDEGHTTPVLIVSARGAAEAARELGVAGALEKPFDIQEFVDAVRRACHGPDILAPDVVEVGIEVGVDSADVTGDSAVERGQHAGG